VNSVFDYLLHGARLLRELGSVDGEPVSAGKVRLRVYVGASPWRRLARLHLEYVFTSIISFSATPLQLDSVGTDRLLAALHTGEEVQLRAARLQLLGRQELHVEPHVGGGDPHPAKLTFLYFGPLLAYEWRSIELGLPAVTRFISLVQEARPLLSPGDAAT
jgi:hypothetical protein